jgi:Uroporphyrinogen decarboxylase (URO-D)
MSRQLALDTLALRAVPRFARTEYSLEYQLARRGAGDEQACRELYASWGLDFLWRTDDGLLGDWGKFGRSTDMGHAEYATGGTDMHLPATCPFTTPEEVWAFDAVAEYGLPTPDEQVAAYEASLAQVRVKFPDQLSTGGYYKTIVSGAIQAFGWDLLLEAAADPGKMEKVFDSFFRRTRFHMEAWARTSVEAVIQHDDFVWTAGAFMRPEIYRSVIIPRYAELWKPLRRAGKKVLFCSDGDFREFAGDIVEAGADGLIFEPVMEFGEMTARFGGSTVLVGSAVDCRDLTFGTWETVKATVDRSLELARKCRGVILATGNHLPANIPAPMLERYRSYLEANRNR